MCTIRPETCVNRVSFALMHLDFFPIVNINASKHLNIFENIIEITFPSFFFFNLFFCFFFKKPILRKCKSLWTNCKLSLKRVQNFGEVSRKYFFFIMYPYPKGLLVEIHVWFWILVMISWPLNCGSQWDLGTCYWKVCSNAFSSAFCLFMRLGMS